MKTTKWVVRSTEIPPMWILWCYLEAQQSLGLDWQVA